VTTRILVPFLFFAVLAAACGGGSSPHATPTTLATATRVPSATPAPTTQAVIPFTPIEEVLTPPPDIDTSAWLTYRDDANGFELKYPPEAQVKKNVHAPTMGPTGIGTDIDLPFEQGTTLEAKYIFIKVADMTADKCAPPSGYMRPGATPDVRRIRNGTDVFWSTSGTGATMMHGFYTTSYMTGRDTLCVMIDAVLFGVSSSVFSTPPPVANDAKESETFAAIISTFRWID
jgi:hypothetical protein